MTDTHTTMLTYHSSVYKHKRRLRKGSNPRKEGCTICTLEDVIAASMRIHRIRSIQFRLSYATGQHGDLTCDGAR